MSEERLLVSLGAADERGCASVLRRTFTTAQAMVIACAVMGLLTLAVHHFQVPNPNIILGAGLVICSALTGYRGGVVAALIMVAYSLWFFSQDHGLVAFTPENLQKMIVVLIGTIIDLIFVCELKSRELTYARRLEGLTMRLAQENRVLQELSATDALTRVANRMALRRDFPTFLGEDVSVAMIDLDDFKAINDTYGHDEGDKMLFETGSLLAERFGHEHCYRYGGDEFLVIDTDADESSFLEKLSSLIDERPWVDEAAEPRRIGYSIGYAHGRVARDRDLRDMFSAADERMYRAKRAGTNLIVGEGLAWSS